MQRMQLETLSTERENYDVYSLKAGETSIRWKSYEYSTLYLVQNLKRGVENIKSNYATRGMWRESR